MTSNQFEPEIFLNIDDSLLPCFDIMSGNTEHENNAVIGIICNCTTYTSEMIPIFNISMQKVEQKSLKYLLTYNVLPFLSSKEFENKETIIFMKIFSYLQISKTLAQVCKLWKNFVVQIKTQKCRIDGWAKSCKIVPMLTCVSEEKFVNQVDEDVEFLDSIVKYSFLCYLLLG